MKIDQSNALTIASIGAALWWIIFGLPALNDIFSAHPSDKRFILALAILFGSLCGSAFYICLMPSMLKAMRTSFASNPGRTTLIAAWSLLPLVPILASIVVIFTHVAEIGNA